MSRTVWFESCGSRIQGRLFEVAAEGPAPAVLLLQGSPGNEEDVLGLGEWLVQRRYNVLTFNYRGTHSSEGLWSFANSQLDIAAAYRFLIRSPGVEVDTRRVILGGWSYGGGMALTYAARHPEIPAVFAIAGTDHGEFIREYKQDPDRGRMIDGIFSEMAEPGSPWRVAPGESPMEAVEQGVSFDEYDLRLAAPNLIDKHLLMVGGWDDHNVKIDNHLLPLYRTLRRLGAENVSILAFQDDHSFSNVREELAESVLGWMDSLTFDPPPSP